MGLVSEQSRYNLSCRMPELEVIPACRHYGMGLIPWSPVGGGLLGGILESTPKEGRRKSKDIQDLLVKYRNQIGRYEKFCQDIEQEPAVVAQAWLLNNPVVTAPIIGPRTTMEPEAVRSRISGLPDPRTIFCSMKDCSFRRNVL